MHEQSVAKRNAHDVPQEAVAPIGLPPSISSSFEQAYNYSFGDVRVFPEQSNLEPQQLAVAQGNELKFAPGAYQPDSNSGRWLIGHELFHVAQQHSSAPPAPNAVLEHEADFAATAGLKGQQVQPAFGVVGQQPLAFEAWEHRDLGDAHGGSAIVVTTTSGVPLTYGQMVALSGDFYRSPSDLMNAPRDELLGILAIMDNERREVAASHGTDHEGRPSGEEIAENNGNYEYATYGSRTLHHHDHADDGADEHEGDEHDEHQGEVHDGMNDPESNGASGGASPDSDATFLELADNNPSHFSPENIRDNFIPKHEWALHHAHEVWRLRNPNQPEPTPIVMGERSSARAGTADAVTGQPIAAPTTSTVSQTPATSTVPSTTPTATDSTPVAPTPTTPTTSAIAQDPNQLESEVWMVDAFSNHFLTDAFAGGHLISGIVGRDAGEAFLSSHASNLQDAFAGAIAQDHPLLPQVVVNQGAAGLLVIVQQKGGSFLLLAAHDTLNREGIKVRNARGDIWETPGDARLSESPETQQFAANASRASRESIQEVLSTGTTTRGHEALDYIPDVASFHGGAFETILDFAVNPEVFNTLFTENALNPTHDNPLYQRIRGGLSLAPALALTPLNHWMVENGVPRGIARALGAFGSGLSEEIAGDIRIASGIETGVTGVVGGVTRAASGIASGVTQGVSGIASGVTRGVSGIASGVTRGVSGIASGFNRATSGIARGMAEVATGIESGIEVGLESGVEAGLSRGASGVASGVATGVSGVASGVATGVSGVASGVATGVSGVASGVVTGVSGVANGAAEAASGVANGAAEAASGVASGAAEAASGIPRVLSGRLHQDIAIAQGVTEGAISLYQETRRLAAGGVARALEPGNPTADPNAATPASQSTPTTPLQHQTYAHGAFMGAGVAMMNDSHWQQIFSTVMPEAYARARNLTEPEAVMAELENNPVLAAYGQSQSLAQSGASAPSADHPSVAMEWDVWLPQDRAQIGDLNQTRIAHGNRGTTIGQRVAGDQEFGRQRAEVANAPGADQWMTYFGRAIALHRAGDAAQHDPQGQADLEQATSLGDTSAATRIAASYLRAPSGLYLDVKSTYSTPDDINAFIGVLRNQGINVIGVGSFSANQLQGLDANVRPIQFFNGIADLQLAVQSAPGPSTAFHNGDSVMLNAGSLLTESRAYVVAGERSYTVDADAVARLRTFQTQFGLRVGLYVQETSVDAGAVEQIVQLVNGDPDLFSLGFAYGNLSDRAEATVTGTGLGEQEILEDWAKLQL